MSTLQEQARALGDPTRHTIFTYVTATEEPVDVAELTDHLGLNHNAIRQHLAKLVDAGLVGETTAAPSGPGRPRLVYRVEPAAESRWGVSGPYERLSVLLTEIIRTGDTPVEVGRRAGSERDRQTSAASGDAVAAIADAMAREGFDPEVRRRRDRVDIILRACPFESGALSDPDTVCQLHLGMAEGMAETIGGIDVQRLVAKDPRRARCRLELHVGPTEGS